MRNASAFIAFFALVTTCSAEQPNLRAWVMSTSTNAAISAIAPEVHSVKSGECFVYVESAGLSLHSFGPLEANQYDPPTVPRELKFRIPRRPHPSASHPHTPLGVIGVFATGLPIYNAIGTASYSDQNIWHTDAVAASSILPTPLLSALTTDSRRHSPIIGFALDGYPIYGPFGVDAEGTVRRMRSSYRLRSISRRDALPNETVLMPAQEGPAVSRQFPLGTFAEDFEYAAGSGDLDEFNGRFAITPDYPDGTYAYFLATEATGALQWPYLIGPRYYGDPQLPDPERIHVQHQKDVDLWTDRMQVRAGEAVPLTLVFRDVHGQRIRFLETVHQKPVHLIVVSKDLAEFDHIHPEPGPNDSFAVNHTFLHSGDYWLYADYTAPGAGPSVARFSLSIAATVGPAPADPPITGRLATSSPLEVTLAAPEKLRTGQDIPFSFHLTNTVNGQPVADLEPWLGAWAHILIVSADGRNFIHAHPVEDNAADSTVIVHTHAPFIQGPSPSTIRTVTGFDAPGIYKLWLQVQWRGDVITVPWTLHVAEPVPQSRKMAALPPDAIRVTVTAAGFSPSRLQIPAGRKAHIAFTRTDAQNCANEVVLPELNLRRPLPAGSTVVIDIPAGTSGELHFACGMGMHRGSLILLSFENQKKRALNLKSVRARS